MPFQEAYVKARGPAGPLAGTSLAPAGSGAPVVLMIPGSGPVDRDGNSPQGLRASSLRLLAEGLEKRGIASVRVDKRGMFESRFAVADANAVTIRDYAADVHSWVAAIRQRTNANGVWALGHSEGGLVALAAAREASDICGLVLVSAPGRPIGVILREQLRSNPANAPILDEAFLALTELEAGRHVDPTTLNPALLPLFRTEVQDFLIDEMTLDPATLIASFRKPILILQGDRDLQVSTKDAFRLKEANPAAKLVILQDSNHVLKTVTSDDRAANIATYTDPTLPLGPHVVAAIADFVRSATDGYQE